MTTTPSQPSSEHPHQEADEHDRTAGGSPQAGPELGDLVAEQDQTGMSSPDTVEHAGQSAPASEGGSPAE